MKTSTIILLAAVAVLLTVVSSNARGADIDNDDDSELSEQQERMSARSMFGEDEDDSMELHERVAKNRTCVRCRGHLFKCCSPRICIQRTVRMNKCLRVKVPK
jgi:hypothetical protein